MRTSLTNLFWSNMLINQLSTFQLFLSLFHLCFLFCCSFDRYSVAHIHLVLIAKYRELYVCILLQLFLYLELDKFTFFLSEIQCGMPPEISYAKLLTTPQSSYGLGDVLRFRCRNGYKFATEYDSITCESDGDWSDILPSCIGTKTIFLINDRKRVVLWHICAVSIENFRSS